MIIEFDTCFVDNFDWCRANKLKEKMRHVWWKGKVTHPPLAGENLYLSEQQIQVFSHSSQTTHLLLGFNEIEVLL